MRAIPRGLQTLSFILRTHQILLCVSELILHLLHVRMHLADLVTLCTLVLGHCDLIFHLQIVALKLLQAIPQHHNLGGLVRNLLGELGRGWLVWCGLMRCSLRACN